MEDEAQRVREEVEDEAERVKEGVEDEVETVRERVREEVEEKVETSLLRILLPQRGYLLLKKNYPLWRRRINVKRRRGGYCIQWMVVGIV